MKYLVVVVLCVMTLVGCAGKEPSMSSRHSSSPAVMGETVREVSAYGFITQISKEQHTVNIKHAPIPEMNWAPMVMDFKVVEEVDLSPFKRGDKVQFVLEVDQHLNYRIRDLTPLTK